MSRYDQVRYAEDKSYAIKCTQSSDPSATAGELSCIADSHQETENGKANPPWWDEFFTWPEGVTAILLLCTLIGILWQSWETRQSAQAARDSIRLQEVAMLQWVNVLPLSVGIPKNLTNPRQVTLQFEIVNRTDFLLTIRRIETEVTAHRDHSSISKIDCNVPLVPRKSDDDSSHPFFARTTVDMGSWSEKGRIFIVAGTITYLNCSGKEERQDIQELYLGFMDGRLERMKPAGMVPATDDADKET
jgi:hypothetical protein